MVTIKVSENPNRRGDYNDKFIAVIKGKETFCGYGDDEECAIGDLIRMNPEEFDVKIELSELSELCKHRNKGEPVGWASESSMLDGM